MPEQQTALTRRRILYWACLAASSPVWWSLTGCATNPVTGRSELMLVSRQKEIALDRQKSPHQFSADYGPVQDQGLNDYLGEVGHRLAGRTHRPNMPYSFRAVNAVYVNAYAFPGGSIAATRGILLELDNEAQLAALLGHELGHVNARHTASRMSTGILLQGLLGGAGAFVSSASGQQTAEAVMQIGGLGAGALLAKYSRDDEREADRLGMEYMVRAGYDPQGMVGLMDVLRGLSSKKPSMVERMFATHPMSSERYKTAVSRLRTSYPDRKSLPVYRQRYLDQTARLRKKTAAIEAMQEGEWALAAEDQDKAVKALSRALTLAPEDYAGLVLMGKCQLARDKPSRAGRYFDKARAVYPQEPQADYFFGVALLYQDKFDQAYAQFQGYEQELPGNPNTIFLQGLALEGAGRRKKSARAYVRFLRTGASGKPASYARGRLKKWGYL